MCEIAKKRGARVASAEFCWPSMNIYTEKLEKMVRQRKKKRGLFVFPPQSQVTWARYAYQWMSLAKENGWHVVLDACSLGPKDMDTLGLSFKPDFIVCSFFKIFGEDPSRFAGLFIKRSKHAILDISTAARSIGIISIVSPSDISGTNWETQPSNIEAISPLSLKPKQDKIDLMNNKEAVGELSSKTVQSQKSKTDVGIECRCLDHADSVGLVLVSSRLSCLADWLVTELMKLKHPQKEDGRPVVFYEISCSQLTIVNVSQFLEQF